jgi:hypothetical protein
MFSTLNESFVRDYRAWLSSISELAFSFDVFLLLENLIEFGALFFSRLFHSFMTIPFTLTNPLNVRLF